MVYRKYAKDQSLYALEDEARAARRGWWAGHYPVPPWQWRKERRVCLCRSNSKKNLCAWFIRQKMTVTGERIVYELRGVSCLPLELAPPLQGGGAGARAVGQLLAELAPIEEALTHFASRAGEKLRKQGLMSRQLSIFLETYRFSKSRPFYAKSVSLKLPYPSDYTPELIHYGLRALRHIYKAGYHYQKCGIMCLDLVATSRMRTDLLDARDQTRLATLMQTMDDINTRYGRGTAHFGAWGDARGAEPRWTMRSDHCSPRYTTSWAELARVR